MNGFRIVPMQESHLDELAEISRLCFSMPWSRAGLAAELSSDTAHFWVAEENGRCIGFAGMHAVCGECYVDLVAVRPSARRRGVGERLVEQMIAWMEETRGEFITLEVRASNAPAIALYEKLGFERAGLRRGFYEDNHEDALLLTRHAAQAVEAKSSHKEGTV